MKTSKHFKNLKKDIKLFLSEEEGGILEKDIIKYGLTVIGAGLALSGLMKANDSLANCAHSSHGSHGSHGSHSSHGSHGSHGSHSSHGSHGSHGSHSAHASHGAHGAHGAHGSHCSGSCW